MKQPVILLALLLALTACDDKPQGPAQPATEMPAEQGEFVEIEQPSPVEEQLNAIEAQNSNHLLLCPADYSAAAGFAEFLAELETAIARKDMAFLDRIVPEDIRFSFGAENGKSAFLAEWELDTAAQTSPFWDELTQALQLNGYVEGENVIFPCTFKALPEDNWMYAENPQLDGYSYAVVTDRNASLKDNNGEVFRPLVYGETLLRVDGSQTRFLTHDGLEGTVEESAIRNPVDYRAFFRKEGETWTMPLFIAGD